MSEHRLRDEELHRLELTCLADEHVSVRSVELAMLVDEVRASRLTAEEREALEWSLVIIETWVPEHRDPECKPMRALSALTRLLNGGLDVG